MNLLLSSALALSQKFWYVGFHFIQFNVFFPLIFPFLISELFRNMLLRFQVFGELLLFSCLAYGFDSIVVLPVRFWHVKSLEVITPILTIKELKKKKNWTETQWLFLDTPERHLPFIQGNLPPQNLKRQVNPEIYRQGLIWSRTCWSHELVQTLQK